MCASSVRGENSSLGFAVLESAKTLEGCLPTDVCLPAFLLGILSLFERY